MTKDEALRMALEALDAMANEGWLLCGSEGLDNAQTKCVEAITAIKEALAQPEHEPSYWLGYGLQAHTEKPFEGATPVYTTPPQRKQLTDEDKAILEAVHRELDRNCDEGNAPGHSHRIKGVWDEDNGKLAGKPCAWCLTWAKFTALIENEAAHGIKENT